MQVGDLLSELGYGQSPNFLRRGQAVFETAPAFGHIFRLAEAKLGLQGVYALRPSIENGSSPIVPVVYVCSASSAQEAKELHRLVWNQDVVPFVIVHTRDGVNLYSGFRHCRLPSGKVDGELQSLTDFNNISDLIEAFHADAIDSGTIWRKRGQDVTPDTRVDWKLLSNLRKLDKRLQDQDLPRGTSHALIGKYVYLHYLRDREILSPKKLRRWDIEPSSVFGRTATLAGVRTVIERLDEWLNGSVFPLDFNGQQAAGQDHLRYVAGVFEGDEVTEIGDRQLSLDFKAYNFSFIPIETLSVVYEQFLHAPEHPEESEESSAPTRGRKMGAYYTPIPVVNLMLAELEERRPLEKGMRVMDPSCGSGAFLVQCYRSLIEKEFPPGSQPKPGQLRDLLEKTIFGVDVESDACNVTELSLILTLLDYVDPPDLEGRGKSQFKLPVLRGNNIFCANFFETPAANNLPLQKKFDWIVGNPPWKRLSPDKLDEHDRPVWKWIQENEKYRPVLGNQSARAFAWELLEYLAPDGEAGFFLPAMTLFEDAARGFRQAFFQQVKVHAIVNFSNLAEVLAGKRFRLPAAAFFFKRRDTTSQSLDEDEFVRTYSPLVANQEATRPDRNGVRKRSWSIVVNASEIHDIPSAAIADGSGLPWKLASWGSQLDQRLLHRLNRRFRSLRNLERNGRIIVSEGLQLRPERKSDSDEEVEPIEAMVGKNKLDVTPLKRLRHVFVFPRDAIVAIEPRLKYVRVGRSELPLSVCRPPHVIVSAARNFAVYHDKFLVVPPRQIGIVSPTDDRDFLRALSLYLSSDFAFYHQFLTSTEFGVKRDRATLNALRNIPVAIESASRNELKKWSELHSKLIQTKPRTIGESSLAERTLDPQLRLAGIEDTDEELDRLLDELNVLVSESLGLDDGERALIHDMVHVRLALNDGKTGKPAVRPPKVSEIQLYAERVKSELDDFLGGESAKRHQVVVIHDGLSGMVQIDLIKDAVAARKIRVTKADNATAAELERTRRRLRDQRSQWVYFDRNLRIYEGTKTFVFKPMQRFHWTESQAMVDARQIIAETLQGGGAEA